MRSYAASELESGGACAFRRRSRPLHRALKVASVLADDRGDRRPEYFGGAFNAARGG